MKLNVFLICRSLAVVKKYKMRENHVFFMYVLYPIMKDLVSDIRCYGRDFFDGIKHILMACHKTKGFSFEVIETKIYFNYFIRMYTCCCFILACSREPFKISEDSHGKFRATSAGHLWRRMGIRKKPLGYSPA